MLARAEAEVIRSPDVAIVTWGRKTVAGERPGVGCGAVFERRVFGCREELSALLLGPGSPPPAPLRGPLERGETKGGGGMEADEKRRCRRGEASRPRATTSPVGEGGGR